MSPVPARHRVAIEDRIKARIKQFDIPALLDVLHAAGYRDDQIEFRSNATSVHQGALIHGIDFKRGHAPAGGERRVVITVNLGLRSLQTPLPSFFLKALEGPAEQSMADFLAYFDHMLLRERFASIYPERSPSLLPGWDGMAKDRLRLLRMTSPSSLDWLFRKVYPELEVRVRRQTSRQHIPTPVMRLGSAALGDGTSVGGYAEIPVGGIDVELFADEPHSGTGVPWAAEIERRLDEILVPLLAETALPLRMVLIVRDGAGYARVRDDSFLGYDAMRGPPKPAIAPPPPENDDDSQKVPIFNGDVTARAVLLEARRRASSLK